jgi:hypothetical protein
MIVLSKSPNGTHKWRATFPDGRKVNFGRQGYSDYTKHHDAARMMRYLARHRTRENWGVSGKYTAGFWSRWILWSEPTLQGAVRRTQRLVGNKIIVR